MKKILPNFTIFSLMLGAVFSPSAVLLAGENDLSICHIANAGYSVSDGKRMVLIDSLYRDIYPGDQKLPPALRLKITSAKAPYNLPTNILVTHVHEDHFEASDIITYLTNNKQAHALMTPQAWKKMAVLNPSKTLLERSDAILPKPDERLVHNAVGQVKGAEQTFEVYYLDHNNPAQNLGYYFEMAGKSFYHVGDTNQSGEDLDKVGYEGPKPKSGKIDYLFIPFWYFLSEGGVKTVKEKFPAEHIIPIHLPEAEPVQKYFARHGGYKGVVDKVKGAMPNTTVMTEVDHCLSEK